MLADDAGAPIACARCGRALTESDPDEDPTGYLGDPLCGECYRDHEFFAVEAVNDALHDEHDENDG